MDLGIKNKVALVTGGTQGIGKACAQEFIQEGCKVVIASRTPANVETALGELRQGGAEVAGIAADCTTREGIEKVVQFCKDTYGSPDIAIFNIDSGAKGAFLDIDDDTFEEAYKNNVMAMVWLTRAVIPHMKEQNWGRILTIGTNSVKQPHRALPRAAQNTTRVGALALSKTLSAELGPFGITVNTLGTGGIATDQFKRVFTAIGEANGKSYEEQLKVMTKDIPVGRIGEPEDMAAAAAFLCSTRSGYITGQVLIVDGGQLEVLQ